jgi:hypothetical protein
MMHVRHLISLVHELPPPLGLDPTKHGELGHVTAVDVSRYVFQMDLQPHSGSPDKKEPELFGTFHETLACLVKDMELVKGGSPPRSSYNRKVAVNQAKQSRTSKSWEQILPPPESPVGRKWVRRLRDDLSVPLYGVHGKPNHYEQIQTRTIGTEAATLVIARRWCNRMREMRRAKEMLQEARAILKASSVHFKDASCQTSTVLGDDTTRVLPPTSENGLTAAARRAMSWVMGETAPVAGEVVLLL